MTLYYIKNIKGKKQRVWNTGRCRGIEDYSKRIGNFYDEIEKGAEKGRVRVLDLGCGYGNVLLDLKRLLGDKIETYGINLEPRWNLKLIRQFGLAEKIFTKADIDKNLPKLYIGESSKGLPYSSNYFDYILSVASMQYVPDKARLIEECNRVLKKDGICRIQHGFTKHNYVPEYKNHFEIWDNKGKRIDWRNYLNKFKNIQFKTEKGIWEPYLILKKAKNFNLGLKLISSLDVNKINLDWWGTKSVYIIK